MTTPQTLLASPELLSPVQPANKGGTNVNMSIGPESIASIVVSERRAQLRSDEAASVAQKERLMEQLRAYLKDASTALLADILSFRTRLRESLQPIVLTGFLQSGNCLRDVNVDIFCSALEVTKSDLNEEIELRDDLDLLTFKALQFRADVNMRVFSNKEAVMPWPAPGAVNASYCMAKPILTSSGAVSDKNEYAGYVFRFNMGSFAPPDYIHDMRKKYADVSQQINMLDRKLIQLRKLLNSLGEVRDAVMAELAGATLERLPEGPQLLERLRAVVGGLPHLQVDVARPAIQQG